MTLEPLDPHAEAKKEAAWAKQAARTRRQRDKAMQQQQQEEQGSGTLCQTSSAVDVSLYGGSSGSLVETNALASANTGTVLDADNLHCGYIDAQTVRYCVFGTGS